MKTILSLVLFLAVGFIASRGLFTRAKGRLPVGVVFLTGIEFFFLGVLFGPRFLNLISAEVLADLRPVIYLALGWAGLLFGIQMSRRHLSRLSRGIFKLLIWDALLVMLLSAVALAFLLRWVYPQVARPELLSSAAVLAIAAAVSSPTITHLLARLLPSRGKFTAVMKVVTALGGVVPLVAFGLHFTIVHPGFFAHQGFFLGFLLWLFANGVALVMGFVFVLLTRQRTERDERLLIIMGTTILVGGICYWLQLSALYTATIMGVVVANSSHRRVQLFEQLMIMEKPLYIGFLIVVGAMVNLSGASLFVVCFCYVVLRILLRLFVTSAAIWRQFPEFKKLGVNAGLAFSAQGALALTIALDYGMGTQGALVDIVVAVIALSVVVNEIIGVILVRRAYAASGEIPEKAPPPPPRGGERAVR
jgi:Kef-type K+ transport system membrane component KefB